jgi:Protein of unknown function (DUF1524)
MVIGFPQTWSSGALCRHLLEGLENYGWKELSDTSNCSIEHIMPQNERLNVEWRKMLGENWKEVQKNLVASARQSDTYRLQQYRFRQTF